MPGCRRSASRRSSPSSPPSPSWSAPRGGDSPATGSGRSGAIWASAVVARWLFPLVMQSLIVAPTELTRETPYLRDHIVATRQAWGLDSVELRELNGEAALTLADIRANAPTIENVRLWDRAPLLMTFGQLQEIRTYYDFVSVDDDRYWIDGKYRQVLLSPRELNPAALPTRTFINEHLTFTHGMGLTLGPVNQVTTEGLPVLFVKDLPPVSSGSLTVTRPQIYYGELARDYVFVEYPPAGVRPSLRRGERVCRLCRHRWRTRGESAAPPAPRLPLRLIQDPVLPGHHQRQPDALLPEHHGAGREGAALSPVRSRPLPRDRSRRRAALDPRRLYRVRPLSLLPAAGRRHDLHAEQRQARHRRLQWLARRLCERPR